jgi:transcriptional regulator with XRE-family HTH domain
MGLSQGKLAIAAGLERTHVNRIENGGIGLPETETRERFHRVFGTTEQELIDLGIVPQFDEWGRRVPPPPKPRGIAEARPQFSADAPLTEAELDELKDFMFSGLHELNPAELRQVLEVYRSHKGG